MKTANFPAPQHPLITLVNSLDKVVQAVPPRHSQMLNFYKISFGLNIGGTVPYGRTKFDYLEGGLFFAAPTQIMGSDEDDKEDKPIPVCFSEQLILLIHPEFLLNYPLAKKSNSIITSLTHSTRLYYSLIRKRLLY